MKVLLVEDDASLREGMAEIIADLAQVREAGSEAEALAALASERFVLVISDLRISAGGGPGGRAVLEAARRRQQAVAIVSASVPEEVAQALSPHVPDAVLGKPFLLEEITTLVERFLALRQGLEELARARELPPEPLWTEQAPGVRVATGTEGAPAWVRLAPGSGFPWRIHTREGREGVLLIEGDLAVEGERYTGPQYFFLGAGQAPEARTQTGCLAVTLGLKGPGSAP